jgi:hypothetical protein
MKTKTLAIYAMCLIVGGGSSAIVAVEHQSPIIELAKMQIDGDISSRVDLDAVANNFVQQQIVKDPSITQNPFSGAMTAIAIPVIKQTMTSLISEMESQDGTIRMMKLEQLERGNRGTTAWIVNSTNGVRFGLDMSRKKDGWKVVGIRELNLEQHNGQ